MQDPTDAIPQAARREPWSKGKLIGAKPPLRPKHVWQRSGLMTANFRCPHQPMMKARSGDSEMSQDSKGFAMVTGASSGIAHDWIGAFAQRAAEGFADVFAENVVLEATTLVKPVQGRENVKQVMSAASKTYKSLEFTNVVRRQ